MLDKLKLNINFAYDSFKWDSDAKNKAQVTVTIIGFAKHTKHKRFFQDDIETNPKYISPYLISSDKPLGVVQKSSKPLNGLPEIKQGNQPIDDQAYIFKDVEKNEFLKKEPNAKKFFRRFIGAEELIKGKQRWILKLYDAEPSELRQLKHVQERIKMVKEFRSKSKSAQTRKMSKTPTQFNKIVSIKSKFVAIPRHSSNIREYIPIDYFSPEIIPSDATCIIDNANVEIFGLITSKIHMIWLKEIGGKLETRYRYSGDLIYNTFPVPKEYSSLKPLAQNILDIRKKYPKSSLADLYDPKNMKPDLRKAHQKLDKAVERLYRKKPFESDQERLEFLLSRYAEMVK